MQASIHPSSTCLSKPSANCKLRSSSVFFLASFEGCVLSLSSIFACVRWRGSKKGGRKKMVGWRKNRREMKLLVNIMLPLCVHWIAQEMTHSAIVDVTTNALCPDKTSCSEVIYLNGLQQTITGIFKMVVLPVLGQFSDEYGRKPILLITVSASIAPFTLIAINNSKGFVYAYFVLRIISNILSQGSIFCITAAYMADVLDDNKKASGFSWMMGLFSTSHVLGNVIARLLPGSYIFEVAVPLLIFCPIYMILYMTETVTLAPIKDQNVPFLKKVLKIVRERYESMRYTAIVVRTSII